MNNIKEFRKLILLGLCTPGFLAIAAFYPLVLATRLHLGHWPYYANPDAGNLSAVPYPYWHIFVTILFGATYLSGLIGLLFAIAGKKNKSRSIHEFSVLCVATCAISFALVLADPGDFINWFFD